jgi:hypothetical protein
LALKCFTKKNNNPPQSLPLELIVLFSISKQQSFLTSGDADRTAIKFEIGKSREMFDEEM